MPAVDWIKRSLAALRVCLIGTSTVVLNSHRGYYIIVHYFRPVFLRGCAEIIHRWCLGYLGAFECFLKWWYRVGEASLIRLEPQFRCATIYETIRWGSGVDVQHCSALERWKEPARQDREWGCCRVIRDDVRTPFTVAANVDWTFEPNPILSIYCYVCHCLPTFESCWG